MVGLHNLEVNKADHGGGSVMSCLYGVMRERICVGREIFQDRTKFLKEVNFGEVQLWIIIVSFIQINELIFVKCLGQCLVDS